MKLTATSRTRIDWKAERERIDIVAVATRLMGSPPGRLGARGGRRLWWGCPFHDDRNPSFCIEPGKSWWRCYGCGARGDAATLVMRLTNVPFIEAMRSLLGGDLPSRATSHRPSRNESASGPRPAGAGRPGDPGEIDAEAAAALIAESAARLWNPEGASGLAYLRGRGLSDATIRIARLGWVPAMDLRGRPRGVVLAWFAGGGPTLVKIRQPAGIEPKYREVYRDRDRHLGLYPGPGAILAGRPLIIVEGEFDCLLLGQALADLAGVVTLGSASERLAPDLLARMLSAPVWYAAHDADAAGDKAASALPTRARRVRPPAPFKDWTGAAVSPEGTHGCGVNLLRWWSAILAGDPTPPLFTWDELAGWRWGPALDDPALAAPALAAPAADPARLPSSAGDENEDVTSTCPRAKQTIGSGDE